MKKILSYLLLLPVYFYRGYISPMTPPSCRFVPTCSEYAIEAIKKHGPFKGLYLAVRRILRCQFIIMKGTGSGYNQSDLINSVSSHIVLLHRFHQ